MQIVNEMGLHNVRCDLLSGISAAVKALPIALAFDLGSGVDAETGPLTRPVS